MLRQTRVDLMGQKIVPCQCRVSVWLYWKVFKNRMPNPVDVLPLQIPLSACAFALRAVRRCTR